MTFVKALLMRRLTGTGKLPSVTMVTPELKVR